MSKLFFRLLVLLMSLSLIGIILVQVYWFNTSLENNEEQFKFHVKQVLGNVAEKLQKQEAYSFYDRYNKDESFYLGFENSVKVAVGNEIRIEGLNLTYYPDKETGSPQLTGFKKRNIELISEGNVVDPRVTEVADLTTDDLGSYLSIS